MIAAASKSDNAPVIVENVRILDPSRGLDEVGTLIAADGSILEAGRAAANQGAPDGARRIDGSGLLAIPGLVDARVRSSVCTKPEKHDAD